MKERSMLLSPIKSKDQETIGVICADALGLDVFDMKDRMLLESVARHTEIALQNKLLNDQLKYQKELQLHAMGEISALIAAPITLESVLDRILEWAISLMRQATLGEIRLIDKSTQELVAVSSKGESINEIYRRIPMGKGITGRAAQTKKPQLVQDISNDKDYLPFLKGTKSEIAMPIMKQDKVIGVLNIEHPEVNAFTEYDVQLSNAIANLAAVAIENFRLYEELQRQAATIKAAYDISESAYQVDNLEEFYKSVHGIINQLIFAKNFRIVTFNSNGEITGYLYYIDEKDKGLDVQKEIIEKGLTGYVYRTGRPFILSSEVREELIQKGEIEQIGSLSKSWLGVPLKVHNETIGVLTVHNYDEEAIYGDKEKEMLEFVSEQIAMTIERVRRRQEELTKRNKELEKLNDQHKALIDLAQKLTSIHLNEERIFTLIHSYASQLMDTDNMYIALYDEANDFVHFPLQYKNGKNGIGGKIGADGKPENIIPDRKAGKGRTEEIIRTGKSILIKTRKESEQWYNQPGREEYMGDPLASWIGVPMMIGDKVLGVIATYHPDQDYIYDNNDVKILQSMANIAAIAVQNSRLYRELEDTNQELLKVQHEIADKERELVKSGLAVDIIHKMNNIAGIIPPRIDLIKRKLNPETDPNVFEHLDKIKRDTSVILTEANELRRPSFHPKLLDMEELIGSVVGQLEMMVPPDIKFIFNPQPELFRVYGAREHLEIVIHSVIQNGIKALSGKGEIGIELKNHMKGTEKFIHIIISDTGCGIPQDKKDSIFDFGVSLWTDQKGTGYGLWRARSILKSMNGNIKVSQSELGKGTTFTIELPAQ